MKKQILMYNMRMEVVGLQDLERCVNVGKYGCWTEELAIK
jgi:hypothetical protein